MKNVAERYGVSRKKQDEFAVQSHKKAARAQALNLYADEIVPFTAKYKDKDGKIVEALVKTDEGVRKDASFEGLSKLKPAFKKDGSTTAGNSSQVFSFLFHIFTIMIFLTKGHGWCSRCFISQKISSRKSKATNYSEICLICSGRCSS